MQDHEWPEDNQQPQVDIFSRLTPAQREAVEHIDGPLLVLAGPGSGKTRVITTRVAHLIQQGIRPYQILAITFTNKAAGEMKSRVEALLPGRGVWISTFHSFGVRILRQYHDRIGIDRNFTVYDQDDRVKIVKNALSNANIDNVRFTPETIQGAISKAKNQLLTPEKYAQTAKDFFTQVVASVYAVYEKKMREANAVDFDDLLMWPALALKNNEELRAELDARFRYVLVDEYQDTNKAQYAIARALSVDYPNLCVVGDPDQSIYKWRGSDIKNILDFERDYPDARVIPLSENFRSTQAILKAADSVIAHNKQRKEKTLISSKDAGEPVNVLFFESGQEEADGIVARIKKAVTEGKKNYRDHAILVRMNALTRGLESAFVRERVPYQIVRGLAFFDRKENKDVVAYLRLLLNPRDDLSFLRSVNEPARGVGKTSLQYLQEYAEPREMSLLSAAAEVDKIPAIKGKAASGLRAFVKLIAELRGLVDTLSPDEIIRQVLDKSGYRTMLRDSGDEDDLDRLANVEELITAAHQFVLEDSSRTLADFLENITLASDVDGWDEEQDCVSVMTLHAAKGLEFPVVYLMAVEQGILPHERSMVKIDELEEERRLAFVGITRAKEELSLTHCKLREFRGQVLYAMPSMFIGELPPDVQHVDLSSSTQNRSPERWRSATATASKGWYDTGVFSAPTKKAEGKAEGAVATVEYTEGMLVQHDAYGVGTVTAVYGHGALRKIKIRFAKSGERTFLADKARLNIVQTD